MEKKVYVRIFSEGSSENLENIINKYIELIGLKRSDIIDLKFSRTHNYKTVILIYEHDKIEIKR